MGCVGLIRIICRISRTLFPPNHITKTDRKCQQNRIPPSFACSHFYLHYDDNSSPAKLFSFPSRTVFRSPTSRRAATGRSGLCFCINMVFLQPGAGVPAVPPSGQSRRAPRAAAPAPQAGSGRWAREAPSPEHTSPAGKHPAGEDCRARAGARKHFRKHSFCLDFLVLCEMRILPSLS